MRTVLSDSGKRLLYDVGVYDSDGDGRSEQDVRTRPCITFLWIEPTNLDIYWNSPVDAGVGDGRLLRGDGRDDEPGHANRKLDQVLTTF